MVRIKIKAEALDIRFAQVRALKAVNIEVMRNEILSVIGPANSGKTTFLRALNRMNDLNPDFKMAGNIFIDGEDIYGGMNVNLLRKRVGMIFALPMPLPMSISDNISYGPRMHGIRDKKRLADIVEESLRSAYLWDEVKDRLYLSALKLSGGQQQRLCIARTLAIEPEVVLFDEPCSGLDPISTAKVEEAIFKLKERYTIVLVTNNVKQAARVGERTAFFLNGELIELGGTEKIFTAPKDMRTEDYIRGKFG